MVVAGVIGAVILWTLISKIMEWREAKEEPAKYSNGAIDMEFKTETDKPMPHVDMETTKAIAMDIKKDETAEVVKTIGTRDLFLETLTKMGCQYEIDEEDNQIRFMWQGGHFTADAQNDYAFVVVWYLYWDEYELYDIDSLSRVKRVINDANINYNINVIYSVNEAGSTFHVHSKKHFLFISQIPDIEGYLQSILGQFFQVRHFVDSELVKLKSEEENVSQ